jgi:hypothetical protein
VVAVDEREVERARLAQEPRQRDLRFLAVELDQPRDSGLVQELETAAGEPRVLVGIDDNVSCIRVAVHEQPFAREQRRDAVPEADLDRPRRPFAHDPIAQRLAFGNADADGEDLVDAAVRARNGRPVPDEALDHLAHADLRSHRPTRSGA